MGGNYPMPTIISKGPILNGLDETYGDPYKRLASLQRMRDEAKDILQSGKEGAILTDENVDHMERDWFDGTTDWWNALAEVNIGGFPIWVNRSVPDAELHGARLMIRAALIYALEKSLGLERGEALPKSVDPGDPALKPVRVYWVCGKADGFEAQVVWSQHEIDVFILTPPINQAVMPLATYTSDQATKNDNAPTGMVLVTARQKSTPAQDPNRPDFDISMAHVAEQDGGVAAGGTRPWPKLESVAKTAVKAAFSTTIDDPMERLGVTEAGRESGLAAELLGALPAWFSDKDHPVRELMRLDQAVLTIEDVTVGERTLWAGITATGVHNRLEGEDDRFLGWDPMGQKVKFKMYLHATHDGDQVQIQDVLWDKQSVHGQLGVRAIGRPVLR